MRAAIKYQETIRLANGHPATLRLEKLPHSRFRTILFEEITAPISKASFDNEAIALSFFEHLRNQHHVPKLHKDYERLSKSLKAAIACAREYTGCETIKDDKPGEQAILYLILDGYDKAQVIAAAKAADSYCFRARHTDLDVYFFLPFSIEQASTCTKATEIMCTYLEAHGYKARVSYRLD